MALKELGIPCQSHTELLTKKHGFSINNRARATLCGICKGFYKMIRGGALQFRKSHKNLVVKERTNSSCVELCSAAKSLKMIYFKIPHENLPEIKTNEYIQA